MCADDPGKQLLRRHRCDERGGVVLGSKRDAAWWSKYAGKHRCIFVRSLVTA